jgi:hypothetical protein
MMRKASNLPLLFVVVLALLGSWSCSLSQAGDEVSYYPGNLRIEKGKHLSAKEREVEARFARYLEDHTEQAIARYQEQFGKEINTDNARELSKDYAPGGIEATDSQTKTARATWSNAVHEPASALVKEIYKRELKKPAGPRQLDWVVFTAGGTAAGKTTAIKAVPGVAKVVQAAQIIYDSTLSSLRSSPEKITQALEAGKQVSIIYVHRDPVEAFVNGSLSQPDRMGRTIPLEVFLGTYIGAPKVVLQLAGKYKGDPRVAISVIDNSRGRGKAVVADLDFLSRVADQYGAADLRAKLTQGLEDAYEKGKRGEKGGISETVYRAFKGDAAK